MTQEKLIGRTIERVIDWFSLNFFTQTRKVADCLDLASWTLITKARNKDLKIIKNKTKIVSFY